MSLRNKLTILSITLMSLMTIPTFAENDTQPVNSRIESAQFDVEIKTPEGWSETKDFTSVPETFTLSDQVYRGVQFKNGSELHGCAVFFADDSLPDVNDNPVDAFAAVQEAAFPGSQPVNFSISKVALDGSFAADFETELAKINLKGTVEGNLIRETEDPTKLTLTGSIQADTTKEKFVLGTGIFIAEGSMPISGTIGRLMNDDYEVIIAIWGPDQETQVKDTYRFLEALTIKAKAPVETVDDETIDNTVVVSETAVEVTSDAVVVTESIAVEVVEEAPVATEVSV